MPLRKNETDPLFLPSLSPSEILMWQRSLRPSSSQVERLYALLSEDEKQRAQRFPMDKPQHVAFVTARGTLRTLLGHYLEIPPATVRFCYNPHGKPHLEESHQPLHFNISHSGQWSLYALALDTELGVDLQKMRPSPPQQRIDFAQRFFSNEEFQGFSHLATTYINTAFYACWTRKEAYIKYHGLGLALSLSKFSVSVDPEASTDLLTTPWRASGLPPCQIHDLPAPQGYRAAIALAATHKRILRHCQVLDD